MTLPTTNDQPMNRRVLVVDDNPAIHEDFLKILGPVETSGSDVDAEAAGLFDGVTLASPDLGFEVEVAHQGPQALEMVRRAREAGRPYAVAFVDMRMPPGWDGLTTITRLWEADDEIQTVICTAYSDRSWQEIQATLTVRERWLVVKKPFDKIEVLQLAHALTEKWNLARLASLKVEALEHLVQARTQDLRNAQRVQNEFLANASHELLTPMNALFGFLDLLATTSLNGEQRGFVEEAMGGGRLLHSLICRILDYNRAGAGTLNLERVEFRPQDLLNAVIRDYASPAAQKGLTLQAEMSPIASLPWVGPRRIIHKTLGLLLDNAVKFTPSGLVTLRVGASPGGLEFSITDTGVGLTPQQLEWTRIPFAQVDGGKTRRNTGFGLGLPLAQRLVHAIGGELKLKGAPDRGVVASFTVQALADVVGRSVPGDLPSVDAAG